MHTRGMMTTHLDHWVPNITTLATRLVLIRHEMGWNVKEAALACGIKAQSWREWELGGRRPRDYEGICKQIADRTHCDLIWLMTGDPKLLLPRLDSNQQPFDCTVTPLFTSHVDDYALAA